MLNFVLAYEVPVGEKSGKKYFSRSGKCQGILLKVREFWDFWNVTEISENFITCYFQDAAIYSSCIKLCH